jgi:hypothetical protein
MCNKRQRIRLVVVQYFTDSKSQLADGLAGTRLQRPTLHEAMRTRLPQTEETTVAIATLFAVCVLICGLLGFGFYKLMQPVQNPNPGLAAYNPPPSTVINYPPAAQLAYNQMRALLPETDSPASPPHNDVYSKANTEDTTGRAIQAEEKVEPAPATASTPPPTEQPTAKRAVAARQNSTTARERASVANYYRSARVGPYPGYAAIH